MACFCNKCGRPIADGESCSCSPKPVAEGATKKAEGVMDTAKDYMESMKNRMGIGDPELNKGDAYESDKLIIPDCVNSNEGEIPVKQYNVATLMNRIFAIPYAKAIGRLQVTNKRVIFRAPGRTLAGRTTLQHEFAIDELAGIEARREYVFNLWDLIVGFLVTSVGFLVSLLVSSIWKDSRAASVIMAFVFGIGFVIPFFTVKKRWLIKLISLSCSYMTMFSVSSLSALYSRITDSNGFGFLSFMLGFLGVISLGFALFTLFVYSIKPNLVLIIKTKSASDAICIKRRRNAFVEHTGYSEVIPAEDAERCIREINAMINDIQKLGDFGIEKWKK